MNISFHHPSIGYFLESYIWWSSGKIFALKWSLENVQQKKTNKNGQKSEKKKQKVNIEKAVSLSNKTSWNYFSTFPPNFRSCTFAPETGWSQNYSNSIFTFDSFGLEVTRKQLHLFSVLVQTINILFWPKFPGSNGWFKYVKVFFHEALKDYMYSNTWWALLLWQLCFQ